jgi:hypothetical protein
MFQPNSILSDLSSPSISLGTRAYIGQRAKNLFYDYVMGKFRQADLSQAALARRVGRGPAQINRMLASPSNWTIETVAELLAGICEEELTPQSTPFAGRAQRNRNQMENLREEVQPEVKRLAPLPSSGSRSDTTVLKPELVA